MSVIAEGDHVIFRRDKTSRVFHIRKTRQVYFEKQKFGVDELIGKPYGTTFELDKGKLVKVELEKKVEKPTDEAAPSGTDNRNLLDLDSNQKMSREDIMKMKGEGVSGDKIIEKLIENSETFKNKTEFSQAKFIKKKKRRHMQVFTVLRPTPRLVLDLYKREPQKFCYLRPDSLSQMLNYSNVMYGSNVCVAESCQGLVLSCVLQRMGGSGKLIQLVPNYMNTVCRTVLDYFSFSKDQLNSVYSFPLDSFAKLEKRLDGSPEEPTSNPPKNISTQDEVVSKSSGISSTECMDTDCSSTKKRKIDSVGSLEENSGSIDCGIQKDIDNGENGVGVGEEESKKEEVAGDDTDGEKPTAELAVVPSEKGRMSPKSFKQWVGTREIQRNIRETRLKEAGDLMVGKKLDCLIVACKFNPVPVVKRMLKFMLPSRPVVVFCQFIEPLKEIYTHIKEQQVGVQVKLTESWFREYQVLPSRTHPEMNMTGTGGYLLTFLTKECPK